MNFDAQSADLDQLAEIASKGGIAALEDLANGKQPELTPEAGEAEATNAPAEDPKPEEAHAPSPKQEEKDHATAVSTKDGKGTIPYSVLKGARERASQFEQENAVLRQQIEELTNRVGTKEPAETAPVSVDEADTRITEMQVKVDALKGDFPELAELYAGQMELLQATRKQLLDVQSRYDADIKRTQAAEQQRTADAVQDAIDANPTLSVWQQKAGADWEAAVQVDNLLRGQTEWAEKSFAERFTKVVEMVKVLNPSAEVADPRAEKPTTSQAKRPPVNSLSDIPGGMPPTAGTREQIEELSVSSLGNKFMTMSNDQIQDYLASLGN